MKYKRKRRIRKPEYSFFGNDYSYRCSERGQKKILKTSKFRVQIQKSNKTQQKTHKTFFSKVKVRKRTPISPKGRGG